MLEGHAPNGECAGISAEVESRTAAVPLTGPPRPRRPFELGHAGLDPERDSSARVRTLRYCRDFYPTRPTYIVASSRSVSSSRPATVNSRGAFRNWKARYRWYRSLFSVETRTSLRDR